MGKPTDPDAGTNRANAVSRDNLMNGASLGYDRLYNNASSSGTNSHGYWWTSTIHNTSARYIVVATSDIISPQNSGYKYFGFAVRCVFIT